MKQNKEPKVYVLVLNWNGWQDTIECVESILNSYYKNFKILIIDNDSSDESVENIKLWGKGSINANFNKVIFEERSVKKPIEIFDFVGEEKNSYVTLIATGENLGYAGGNNVGIKYALKKNDADYIWILNNDTVIDKHCIKEMVKYSSNNNEVGLIGSTVMEYYEPDIIQYAAGAKYNYLIGTSNFASNGRNKSEIQKINSVNIDYIAGSSMFIKTSLLKEVGLLCEQYFLYFEEIDLSTRLINTKYKIGWCKNSFIYHKFGASAGSKTKFRSKSPLSEYYSNLSALKYTYTFHKGILVILIPLRFILKTLSFIIEKKFYLFKPMLNAYKDFFLVIKMK